MNQHMLAMGVGHYRDDITVTTLTIPDK